jgi:tRNA (cytidine/uridine-2'-O-)-methyltransferase
MPLHIALLEAVPAEVTGAVARQCAAVDASLHLIGPLTFGADDAEFRRSGPQDWEALDWWLHPGWRAFRDAMSRERCLYFSADAARDAAEAPFRANSVLVLGDEGLALPEKIRDKYPDRVYRLPRLAGKAPTDLPSAAKALLGFAGKRIGDGTAPAASASQEREAPRRRRR